MVERFLLLLIRFLRRLLDSIKLRKCKSQSFCRRITIRLALFSNNSYDVKENIEKNVKNVIMKKENTKKMGILTMGGSGMRNSIGKKVVGMIMLLGLLMVGICVANMSAFSIITGLNKEVINEVAEYEAAAQNADAVNMEKVQKSLESTLGHVDKRINGTYVFDFILF